MTNFFLDIFCISHYTFNWGDALRVKDIQWNDSTVSHIARHGVDPTEVEEVCFENRPFVLRAKYNRYFALGQTKSGRYLAIILEYVGQNRAKVITARAMSEAERRLYKRR